MYTSIDLGVELLVFGFTVFALKRIFPEFRALHILSGLLKMHEVSFFSTICCVWISNLLFQSTYSGMDPLFRFEWLGCEGKENSTWVGGFNWEC